MWWSYESAKEKKARLKREIAKREKRGERFVPLDAPPGQKKLCATFWGQAWCRNLESYQSYENRLPRGRSYLRQGLVYNLSIEPGVVSAVVAGSDLYQTTVHIKPLAEKRWKHLVKAGAGQVSSMLDLLAGKLGDGLMALLVDPADGLFPEPKEIRFDCSCPDYADMCKHVSAVLYGVGVQLDTQPELLFTLRQVEHAELLSDASATALTSLGTEQGELANSDLSALFGIDLDLNGDALVSLDLAATPPTPAKRTVKKAKTAAKSKRSPTKGKAEK